LGIQHLSQRVGGVLLCSLVIGKASVDEVMAAIAVHNIPEGIAIAMPVRS